MPTTRIQTDGRPSGAGVVRLAIICDDLAADHALPELLDRPEFEVVLFHVASRPEELETVPDAVDVLVYCCPDLALEQLRRMGGFAAYLEATHRIVVVGDSPPAHVMRRALRTRIEGIVLAET